MQVLPGALCLEVEDEVARAGEEWKGLTLGPPLFIGSWGDLGAKMEQKVIERDKIR